MLLRLVTLISADGTLNIRGQPVPNLVGKVATNVMMIEGAATTSSSVNLAQSSVEGASATAVTDTANGTPGRVPIVKRRKQGMEGEEQDDDLTNMAASREEDRRAQ